MWVGGGGGETEGEYSLSDMGRRSENNRHTERDREKGGGTYGSSVNIT